MNPAFFPAQSCAWFFCPLLPNSGCRVLASLSLSPSSSPATQVVPFERCCFSYLRLLPESLLNRNASASVGCSYFDIPGEKLTSGGVSVDDIMDTCSRPANGVEIFRLQRDALLFIFDWSNDILYALSSFSALAVTPASWAGDVEEDCVMCVEGELEL
ncbi:hypothetical protein B0J13DRAFT_151573 [Dactylonectria estremocensis]|uniref:Uncharacterized protein n=1 Tax=Dactylonectria estremocensis TaxID=1079267 RepID=A0A9P9IN12_9HYPO|nr:hypothetical protein B0J13DRAFT_151573 [Dactylonectria estremocensis]